MQGNHDELLAEDLERLRNEEHINLVERRVIDAAISWYSNSEGLAVSAAEFARVDDELCSAIQDLLIANEKEKAP